MNTQHIIDGYSHKCISIRLLLKSFLSFPFQSRIRGSCCTRKLRRTRCGGTNSSGECGSHVEERRDVSHSSPSHSSLPLPGGSPSDRPAPLHESPPPPPGGPAALEVSSPAGGTASLPVVTASDQPAPTLSQYTAVTHDMLQLDPPLPASKSMLKKYGTAGAYFAFDAAIATIIIGGVIWHNRHKHHSRTVDPDRYVSSLSHLSRRRLNVPNHKHLT